MEYVILVLSGIIGGMIAGLLGLGGGIFYILILPYIMEWVGIPAHDAPAYIVANSLIGIHVASGVSMLSQLKPLKKYWKESIRIGIPASIFSILTTEYIVHSEFYSRETFNVLVILLMIYILVQVQMKKNITNSTKDKDEEIHVVKGVFSGSIAGITSALSGLGGGIIIIPLLQIRYKQSLTKAKLISLSIIFLSSLFISIQNLISQPDYIPKGFSHQGYILPSIAFPIILGVLAGSPLGVKLSKKMNDRLLNQFFSLFVILVLLEKLFGLLH